MCFLVFHAPDLAFFGDVLGGLGSLFVDFWYFEVGTDLDFDFLDISRFRVANWDIDSVELPPLS